MKIIAYLRVSTAEQADSGAGIEAQRAALLAEAKRRGWDDVDFIVDAGWSAASMKRPGLQEALRQLRLGEANVLAVSKMDRLSRSLLDFAGIMHRAQREGWLLLALDSPADLTSPAGEAMAGVQAVFAQLERRLISQRTCEALAQRKAQGIRLGRMREISPDLEAHIVELRGTGMSVRRIADTLASEGRLAPSGRPFAPSTLHRVLVRCTSAEEQPCA